VATHYNISRNAFSQSVLSAPATLSAPTTLANLGLKPLSAKQRFPTTQGANASAFTAPDFSCQHGDSMTIDLLVACGAMFEDFPQTRPLNHFFNPTNPGNSLSCLGVPIVAKTSPDWALGINVPSDQQNSYANAKTYFENALTTPDSQAVRDTAWGATFQSLGQVIHHLQDMAQPQHVRNDAHADLLGPTSNASCFHESRFEKSTDTDPGLAPLARTAMQAPTLPVYPAYAAQFPTPRAFWTGIGQTGIADYTNANFVSAGTNFCGSGSAPTPNANFALPQPITTQYPDISIWQLYMDADGSLDGVSPEVDSFCQAAGGQTQDAYLQNCYVTMVASTVHDSLPGAVDVRNDRASTFSVFDEDLRIYNQSALNVPGCSQTAYLLTNKIFALNRFNFAATYPFLMSHAVAYSAGLINYFFRGQMDIAPPPEAVYGIIDTSTCFPAGLCGFGKIKLLLKNTTPNDDIGAGTLRAVAKYHLNNCYTPDLRGEFGGDPAVFLGEVCRSQEEYITVSNSVPTSGIGRNFDTQARVFTFANPIPINASDLFLQVVFKGTLGQESDAIAVTTKNISEPNFIAIQNFTDYAFDPYHSPPKYVLAGGDPDSDGDVDSAPVTFPNLTVAFGSNIATVGPTAIATLSSLGGGQHAQLALLMDQGACGGGEACPESVNYISMTWDHGWTADAWIPDASPIPRGVQEFTMDDTGPYAGRYTRTCPVVLSRGAYRQSDYLFFYQQVAEDDVLGGRTLKRKIASAGQVRPKASVASDCQEPTTGIYDFSGMTNAFNPAAANPWQINF
jgi:hypothetical protein